MWRGEEHACWENVRSSVSPRGQAELCRPSGQRASEWEGWASNMWVGGSLCSKCAGWYHWGGLQVGDWLASC